MQTIIRVQHVECFTAVVTAPARALPGDGPDQTGPDQAQQALANAIAHGTATGTYVGPFGNERWVGVFGTHAAAGYGYPYPAAPDCNEGSLGAGCVGDSRGLLQGQCTSWVAYRLAMRRKSPWIYTEGYAVGSVGLAVHHAWVTRADEPGVAYDLAWEDTSEIGRAHV